MKRLSILGFLVILFPFLGFPNTWDIFIYPILGLLILVQSLYLSRKVSLVTDKQEELQDNVYVENDDCTTKEE
ncbi:MAG: hypothetical protein U9P50_00890 [Patescibacteria group bacterium]|nr:hypothetical protein [Patescibacteria group bacterium]